MKSILLIEDNIDILENLAEYLEMEGYQVYSTNNGEKGIELALKFMPDLIICDMPRPGIDGYKVLQALIDNLSITKIPFIFCTTMSEKINRSDALESGADDYITKPFELETILQIAKLCIKTGTKRQKLSA
ncbi:MAG: response regulator [Chitinophagaceae bacterium]|nr:response regulator [Chitinophagaceae bacterium]